MKLATVAVLLSTVAVSAAAQPPGTGAQTGATAAIPTGGLLTAAAPPPPITSGVDWLQRPDDQQMARFYPFRAQEREVSGGARIQCAVENGGGVDGCFVVSEQPRGLGFGAAALQAATLFRMQALNGETIRGRPTVVFPITFIIPGAAQPPAHPVLARPVWSAVPDAAQVTAAGVSGEARLVCEVVLDRLEDCITPSATSAAASAAAIRLAPLFRVAVPTEVEGRRPFDAQVSIAFSPPPESISRPPWAETPTGAEVEAALRPIAAAQSDLTARATLDCRVGPGGALTGCEPTGATPAAAGAALMSLSTHFRVGLWTQDGRPTAGRRLRVPLRYVAD